MRRLQQRTEEKSETAAAAAASTEQSPAAEHPTVTPVEGSVAAATPTVTPVEGSVAATEPAVTSAEDSEKAATSTVTPVADPEKDSLTFEVLPFYAETGSLRAPSILRVALKKGTVVPMAITTGPEILLQPENKQVTMEKLASSIEQAIEGGYFEGKAPGLSQVADGPISLSSKIRVAD